MTDLATGDCHRNLSQITLFFLLISPLLGAAPCAYGSPGGNGLTLTQITRVPWSPPATSVSACATMFWLFSDETSLSLANCAFAVDPLARFPLLAGGQRGLAAE